MFNLNFPHGKLRVVTKKLNKFTKLKHSLNSTQQFVRQNHFILYILPSFQIRPNSNVEIQYTLVNAIFQYQIVVPDKCRSISYVPTIIPFIFLNSNNRLVYHLKKLEQIQFWGVTLVSLGGTRVTPQIYQFISGLKIEFQ